MIKGPQCPTIHVHEVKSGKEDCQTVIGRSSVVESQKSTRTTYRRGWVGLSVLVTEGSPLLRSFKIWMSVISKYFRVWLPRVTEKKISSVSERHFRRKRHSPRGIFLVCRSRTWDLDLVDVDPLRWWLTYTWYGLPDRINTRNSTVQDTRSLDFDQSPLSQEVVDWSVLIREVNLTLCLWMRSLDPNPWKHRVFRDLSHYYNDDENSNRTLCDDPMGRRSDLRTLSESFMSRPR